MKKLVLIAILIGTILVGYKRYFAPREIRACTPDQFYRRGTRAAVLSKLLQKRAPRTASTRANMDLLRDTYPKPIVGKITVHLFASEAKNAAPRKRDPMVAEAMASLHRAMEKIAASRPDIHYRVILISPDAATRFAREYSIKSVPHVMIYDRDGRLLVGDDGNDKAGLAALGAWISRAAPELAYNQFATP